MEDAVYTGRVRFLQAAQGDTEMLSDHAGISSIWAAQYTKELESHGKKKSSRDILSRATKSRRR